MGGPSRRRRGVFVLNPGHAPAVPDEHRGSAASGIRNGDRSSASQAFPHVTNGRLVLACGWTHQRRDFLGVAADWPSEQPGTLRWLTARGAVYHHQDRRLEVREDSEACPQRDHDLRGAVAAFQHRWETDGAEAHRHPA